MGTATEQQVQGLAAAVAAGHAIVAALPERWAQGTQQYCVLTGRGLLRASR